MLKAKICYYKAKLILNYYLNDDEPDEQREYFRMGEIEMNLALLAK